MKRNEKQWKEEEIDPRFWEVLLSAPKKDYERICQEFGVTDFRWMLRKLNQKKKEREAEQSKVLFALSIILISAPLFFYTHTIWKIPTLDFSVFKYVEKIHSLKQIEVKTDGTAEFELDMKLKDLNSKILLFKVSALI